MSDHNQVGNVVLALATGAVIGAGLGILFAPDKGSETRKKIREKVDHTKDDVVDKYNDLIDKLRRKASNAKSSIEDVVDDLLSDGSHKAEDVIELLENKLEALKKKTVKLQK